MCYRHFTYLLHLVTQTHTGLALAAHFDFTSSSVWLFLDSWPQLFLHQGCFGWDHTYIGKSTWCKNLPTAVVWIPSGPVTISPGTLRTVISWYCSSFYNGRQIQNLNTANDNYFNYSPTNNASIWRCWVKVEIVITIILLPSYLKSYMYASNIEFIFFI